MMNVRIIGGSNSNILNRVVYRVKQPADRYELSKLNFISIRTKNFHRKRRRRKNAWVLVLMGLKYVFSASNLQNKDDRIK